MVGDVLISSMTASVSTENLDASVITCLRSMTNTQVRIKGGEVKESVTVCTDQNKVKICSVLQHLYREVGSTVYFTED